MMLAGVLTGGLFLLAGLLEYFVVPRMSPNPWVGVRLGYTFTCRGVWKEANRYYGKVLVPFSAAFIVVSLFSDSVILFSVGVLTVALFPAILSYKKVVELTESTGFEESTGEGDVRAVKPQTVGPLYIVLPFILLLAMIVISLYYYPLLPDRIATHFDLSGNPDGWGNKYVALFFPLIMSAIFAIITLFLVPLARKYPMLFYRGTLKIGKGALLEITCGAMSLCVLMILSVQIYTILNSLHQTSFWTFHAMMWGPMVLFLVWMFLKIRHAREGEK